MSLEKKTVLSTRQAEQAGDLVAELVKRGAVAVVIPMIRIIDPERWEACDDVLRSADSFDAVAFTSANAVRQFFERARALGVGSETWAKKKLYAVGEQTANEIQRRSLAVEPLPESYSAGALAAAMRQTDVRGLRIVLPKGNLGSEELTQALKEMGADVRPIEVYRNAPPEPSALEEVRQRVLKNEFDVITFFSPSAAKHFARAVQPALVNRGKAKIAVIGPTTRLAVRRMGFPVDIEAKTSTAVGLVEAIEEYFGS
ncbi:MAG: hypothetical protein C4326_08610 [Ignavibacteria bacterium]